VDCLKEDHRAVSATDVHHIAKLRERPDLRFEETNLMPLCSGHHDARTARGQ
jgi:5-methylcytosine-specific restriction endonuclease McrA